MNIKTLYFLVGLVVAVDTDERTFQEPRSACDSGPCQNGGQCIDITYPGGPLAFKCACKEGYNGLACQKHVDPCADDPCQNGGVCSPRGEHYHCMCPEAFKGKDCEIAIVKKDPCAEKPCGPHGVCEEVKDQFVCECLPGYHGALCGVPDSDTNVVAVPGVVESGQPLIIKDILIAILFFVVLFAVILIFICCHCCRVWNKRSTLKTIQEVERASGKKPAPLTGWMDLSNQLCYEFFCCQRESLEHVSNVSEEKCCYVKPDNCTGVIVPLKDYNNWLNTGCIQPFPNNGQFQNCIPNGQFQICLPNGQLCNAAPKSRERYQGVYKEPARYDNTIVEELAEPTPESILEPTIEEEPRPIALRKTASLATREYYEPEINQPPPTIRQASRKGYVKPSRTSTVFREPNRAFTDFRDPSRASTNVFVEPSWASIKQPQDLSRRESRMRFAPNLIMEPPRSNFNNAQQQSRMTSIGQESNNYMSRTNLAEDLNKVPSRMTQVDYSMEPSQPYVSEYHNAIYNDEPASVTPSPTDNPYYNDISSYLMEDYSEPPEPECSASRKRTRSELHARAGKMFPQQCCLPNPTNNCSQQQICPPTPTNNFPHQGCGCPPLHTIHHLGVHSNAECFHSNLQSGTQPPPYTWPPTFSCPHYIYPYPCHNNVQNNANSSAAQRGKRSTRKLHNRRYISRPVSSRSAKIPEHKNAKFLRRSRSGGSNCEDSKMDNLRFIEEDCNEQNLASESEDDSQLANTDTESDDNFVRSAVDDDGYGSTNRLSESDAGGRNRDFIHSYPDRAARKYIIRNNNKSLLSRSKLSPRTGSLHSITDNKRDKTRQSLHNSSEESPNVHEIGNSSSEEERDYHSGERSGDSIRVHQQHEDDDDCSSRLIRRGDMWGNSRPRRSSALNRLNILRGENSSVIKIVPKSDMYSPTNTPKKVKGILKNSGNYNRSASSNTSRTSKSTGRHSLRKRRDGCGQTD